MKQAETGLQERIQNLVKKRGGYIIKQHGSMIERRGIPDLIFCYNGLFVSIEAKVNKNTPSRQQGIEIRNIQKAYGITSICWSIEEAEILLDIIDLIISYHYDYCKTQHLIFKALKEKNIDTGETW